MLQVALIALASLASTLPQVAPRASEPATEKIAVKVRYVGDLGYPRGREFVELLERHFETVAATDETAIESPAVAEKLFADAEVLVVDADLTGLLPPAYGKPMVVISGPGVKTAESLGAKLDWL